jgi:hypothetical protein
MKENEKHPGGRPTKYTPELIEKAYDYLENWDQTIDKVPMRAGLAVHCGISRDTVYAWEKDKEKQEFSDIVKKIDAMQERELAARGLGKEFDSSITKLLLSKHGYTDKIGLDHSSTDGTMKPQVIELVAPSTASNND